MTDVPRYIPIICMPDGRPAPFLLTTEELIQFLRVKARFPKDSIDRMRRHGLRGVQVGKHVLFKLDDVLDWLCLQQERVPR